MYGIIGAMESETVGLIEKMSSVSEKTICGTKFVSGKLNDGELVVCRCGIGKVFSSMAAALIIEAFDVSGIINIGVAGGARPLKQGDIVVAEKTVQHDYDATADGLEPGRVHGFDSPYFPCDEHLTSALYAIVKELGYPAVRGTVASGDCFVSDTARAARIRDTFGACAYDMESAAINQVCAFAGKPFTALRAISDNGEDGAVASFYEFAEEAARRSIAVVAEFIGRSANGR